jgi:hypothetical protein
LDSDLTAAEAVLPGITALAPWPGLSAHKHDLAGGELVS